MNSDKFIEIQKNAKAKDVKFTDNGDGYDVYIQTPNEQYPFGEINFDKEKDLWVYSGVAEDGNPVIVDYEHDLKDTEDDLAMDVDGFDG